MSLAAEVEAYIGTPFRHQGRAPGKGLDCAGVWACGAEAAGLEVDCPTDYDDDPSARLILDTLSKTCDEVELGDARPSDVLAFWFAARGEASHLGVLTCADEFVHVRRGRTVERQTMTPFWRRRLLSAWRPRPWQR